MLRRAKEFNSFKLRARDGDIGKARQFYFDDKHWTVRYLVADSGGWLNGRRVLISPSALEPVNEAEQVLPVDLTKKQIEDNPDPIGDSPSLMRDQEASKATVRCGEAGDPNLRSTSDVTGYTIRARDGEIGHVEDFVIDDETWAIRYLVVDTTNWWPGQHVLVSPQWIERVSWDWEESTVFVNLSCEAIKRSPAYTPESLSREYETELHQHYSRQGYWADEPAVKQH